MGQWGTFFSLTFFFKQFLVLTRVPWLFYSSLPLSGALLGSANLATGTPVPRELHPGTCVSAPPSGASSTAGDAAPGGEVLAPRRNASEPAPATSERRRRTRDKDKSKKEDRDRSRRRRREEE